MGCLLKIRRSPFSLLHKTLIGHSSPITKLVSTMSAGPVYTPEFQASLDYVLSIDPTLAEVVSQSTFYPFLAPRQTNQSSFQYLVRNILSQQVSGAAGNAIYKKFLLLTDTPDDEFPSPERVLQYSVEELRTAGLSMRKGEYVRRLAEAYVSGKISDELLSNSGNDEVVDRIVEMYGLGPWTAQMFLIFYLHRSDIFSTGDIGVQRGLRRYLSERPKLIDKFGSPEPANSTKNGKKMPKYGKTEFVRMEAVASQFAPHRTAFQMILWKLSDINMNTVEARDAVSKEFRNKESKKGEVKKISITTEKVKKEPSRKRSIRSRTLEVIEK